MFIEKVVRLNQSFQVHHIHIETTCSP